MLRVLTVAALALVAQATVHRVASSRHTPFSAPAPARFNTMSKAPTASFDLGVNVTLPVWYYDVDGAIVYVVYSNHTGPSGKINLVSAFDGQSASQKPLWHTTVPSQACQAVTATNTIVCISSEDAVLFSIDGKSGQLIWSEDFPGIFPSPTLTVFGSMIYAQGGPSAKPLLVAINPKTGSKLWQQTVPGVSAMALVPTSDTKSVVLCPAEAVGAVNCTAFAAASGNKAWSATILHGASAVSNIELYELVWDDTSSDGVLFAVYAWQASSVSYTWAVVTLNANTPASPVTWSITTTTNEQVNPGCNFVVPGPSVNLVFTWAPAGMNAYVATTGHRAWVYTTASGNPLCGVAATGPTVVGVDAVTLTPIGVDTLSGSNVWASTSVARALVMDGAQNLMGVDAACTGTRCTATLSEYDTQTGEAIWSASEPAIDADFTECLVGNGVACLYSTHQLLCLGYTN